MNKCIGLQFLLISFLLSPVSAFADMNHQQAQAIETMTSFMDQQGNVIELAEGDWLDAIESKSNLLLWCRMNIQVEQCGIIDITKNKLVMEPKYIEIEPVHYKNSVYYVVTENTHKIGVLNDDFQLQIPIKYRRSLPHIIYPDSIIGEDYSFDCSPDVKENYDSYEKKCLKERSEPYLFVSENDKFGLLRFDNTVKQPIIYSRFDISYPSQNKRVLFAITDNTGNTKYGYFNEKFDIVIPAKYDLATPFILGVANVRLNNRFGFINGDNKAIIPFAYEQADSMLWRTGFSEPTASVVHQGVRKLVGLSGKHYRYNISQAQPLTYHHGLALIENGQGKYSFVQSSGELLTSFKYDKAEDFTEHFNRQGEEVVSAQVIENKRSYYIDASGKAIGEFLYPKLQGPTRTGEQIYNGICQVCHDVGLINAPKLGDINAWKDRAKKGKSVLYEHAINGFNAMPAKGGGYISDIEVKSAVDYMLSKVQ